MDGLSLIAVAVALAMDAFAVALAAGVVLRPLCFRPCFRLAFHFGLFQALMPVIGWLAGLTVQGFVAAWSHWIAFCLLVWVGGHMIREALAVGLSLAMLDVVVWLPALVIGLVACAFTVAGLLIGARSGARWGRRVEVAGGAILIAIGLKILLSALFFDRAAAAVAG